MKIERMRSHDIAPDDVVAMSCEQTFPIDAEEQTGRAWLGNVA